MVGSEFGVNNIYPWTQPAMSLQSRLVVNRISLGCGRTGDWQHECAAGKSVEIM